MAVCWPSSGLADTRRCLMAEMEMDTDMQCPSAWGMWRCLDRQVMRFAERILDGRLGGYNVQGICLLAEYPR